jgi:hypothetical protein
MCPVVDLNNDVDEISGEALPRTDRAELFCADRDSYSAHSDVVQPVLDLKTNRWFIYTCREGGSAAPRVALFDDTGRRIWGDLKEGHMDMGWIARLGDKGEPIAMAIRIGSKSAGQKGFFRKGVEEFTYDAFTGRPRKLSFSIFCTLPVDLNGDGIHELYRGLAEGDGVLDAGQTLGNRRPRPGLKARPPGEQVLAIPDGTIRIWSDRNAQDSEPAQARYAHPFYRAGPPAYRHRLQPDQPSPASNPADAAATQNVADSNRRLAIIGVHPYFVSAAKHCRRSCVPLDGAQKRGNHDALQIAMGRKDGVKMSASLQRTAERSLVPGWRCLAGCRQFLRRDDRPASDVAEVVDHEAGQLHGLPSKRSLRTTQMPGEYGPQQ